MKRSKQISAIFLVAGALLAAPAWGAIARIDLTGPIDPITAEFIVRGIERAETEGVKLVLIRLDTPGGFANSMEDIVSKILNSGIPIAVYVTPSGSKAASAGFFILLAADVAAMAPGTNTGAAHPIMSVGGFPVEGGEAGKTLTQKITNNWTAFLRSIANKRNRNIDEAEKGVRESKSFTETEALDKNLVDFVSPSESELIERLEGHKVRMFSGQEVTLRTRGESIVDYEMSTRQRFLATVSQPNLALLLGLAGLILLYFEFSNPGFVAPGVIGGICLLLSILGFSFLPINYVGVLLILLAMALFVAEAKVQGFGILGVGGLVAMVIGALILVDSPDPAVRINTTTAIGATLPFAVIMIILLIAVFRSLRQQASTGDVAMLGLLGVADSEISPRGRVRVRGEYWTARSDSPIPAGRPVRVIGIDNLTLSVEEVRQEHS